MELNWNAAKNEVPSASTRWDVPQRNQGQMVEVAYGDDDEKQRLWRRITDRSNRSVEFAWISYNVLPEGFDVEDL